MEIKFQPLSFEQVSKFVLLIRNQLSWQEIDTLLWREVLPCFDGYIELTIQVVKGAIQPINAFKIPIKILSILPNRNLSY